MQRRFSAIQRHLTSCGDIRHHTTSCGVTLTSSDVALARFGDIWRHFNATPRHTTPLGAIYVA